MQNNEINVKAAKRAFWAAAAFYLLIAFEFFYMASPFAVYFYSVYRPGLEILDGIPFAANLAAFFLPHLVEEVKSPAIASLGIIGAVTAAAGLIVFFICAGQVYYSKIFKKGAVTGGLYKYIRHPQYSAFALCSFGLLLLWPRYLALFMFVTMLFGYYFLAKAEEKECERKFGASYSEYLKKTNMFFFIPLRIFNFGKINSKFIKILAYISLYAVSLTIAFSGASLLRRYSVDSLYAYEDGRATYLSIFKTDNEKFKKIAQIIGSDSKAGKFTDSLLTSGAYTLNYMLPADMHISEIPMNTPDGADCHIYGGEHDFSKMKVVFTRPVFTVNSNTGDIIFNAKTIVPLLEVWIDMKAENVIAIKSAPKTVRYKNIPEPVF